ncbi:hypothetical protein QF034_000649 [Streptomyces africanus]|uniref:Uncharacterized protein n=1 Tax=Streptomyces africanus TaxID=231024 RepID=A0ABU0QGA2_9ACTN|nr:hypothetical protein [Streptomyces africanus]
MRRFIEGSLGSAVSEEEALEGAQQQIEYDGHGGDQHRPAEHLHEVALGQAVEDVTAEAAEGDVRGDRGRGDDLDERQAQARHDQGEGERQLDLEQDLVTAHALPARRVLHVRVDGGHPGVGVGDDRRDRQGDQGHVDRDHGQSAGQEDQDDQADGGERAAERRQVDREERALAGVADQQAQREADGGRDERGEQGVLEVLGEAVDDAVRAGPLGAAGQPAAEVLEEFVHVRLAASATGSGRTGRRPGPRPRSRPGGS